MWRYPGHTTRRSGSTVAHNRGSVRTATVNFHYIQKALYQKGRFEKCTNTHCPPLHNVHTSVSSTNCRVLGREREREAMIRQRSNVADTP